MIMKFRKRPIVIEAEQFFPTKLPHPEGVEQYIKEETHDVNGARNAWFGWRIETLEGPHEVSPGDWIIRGIKGELYPCKPDIFAATYEPVTTGDSK